MSGGGEATWNQTGKNCVESWAFGGKDKICEPRLRTENAGIRK